VRQRFYDVTEKSSDPSMMARLTSVMDFVMDLNGSSCLSIYYGMACFMLKTVVKLKGILT
jgi:hypothetical protein